MAAKFLVLAAFVAVASAGSWDSGLGYAAPALVGHGSQNAISTYSTVQHHVPAVHAYAAQVPAVQTYAAQAPLVQQYAAPVVHAHHAFAAPVAKAVLAEPSAPAHYDFAYGVADPHTGDSKSQHESRRGDFVHGSYSLLESDGTKRVVDYTADPQYGFNAVVHNEPAAHAVAPVVAKVAAPIVPNVAYSAPVAHSAYAAPVAHTTYSVPAAYSAPVAHAAYSAPVAHAAYSAPVAHAAYSAPVAHAAYAAPLAQTYSTSVSHGYAAPLVHGKAGHFGYAAQAPVVSYNVY